MNEDAVALDPGPRREARVSAQHRVPKCPARRDDGVAAADHAPLRARRRLVVQLDSDELAGAPPSPPEASHRQGEGCSEKRPSVPDERSIPRAGSADMESPGRPEASEATAPTAARRGLIESRGELENLEARLDPVERPEVTAPPLGRLTPARRVDERDRGTDARERRRTSASPACCCSTGSGSASCRRRPCAAAQSRPLRSGRRLSVGSGPRIAHRMAHAARVSRFVAGGRILGRGVAGAARRPGDDVVENVACNLCGSSASIEVYRSRDYRLRVDDQDWRIVRCAECGLRLPESTTDSAGDRALLPGLLLRLPARLRERYERQADLVPGPPGRLLDVGTATGEFVDVMTRSRLGRLRHRSVRSGRVRRQGADRARRFPDEAPFPDEHFDVITAWAVFEHLHDPALALLTSADACSSQAGLLSSRCPTSRAPSATAASSRTCRATSTSSLRLDAADTPARPGSIGEPRRAHAAVLRRERPRTASVRAAFAVCGARATSTSRCCARLAASASGAGRSSRSCGPRRRRRAGPDGGRWSPHSCEQDDHRLLPACRGRRGDAARGEAAIGAAA